MRPAATIVTVKLCLATVKHCPLSRILRVFLFSVRCIAAARGPTSPIPCEASLRSLSHASASILFLLAPASNVRPPATTNRRPSAIFLKLRHPEYFSSLFNLLPFYEVLVCPPGPFWIFSSARIYCFPSPSGRHGVTNEFTVKASSGAAAHSRL